MSARMVDQLWQLANEEARRTGDESWRVFDPIGLLPPGSPSVRYHVTPVNSEPFANTGGDGVHYSLLDLGRGPSDASPVVMTVPMNPDKPNLIVGRDSHDFMCLGCRTGYFWLEQLTYDRQETIAHLQAPDPGKIKELWFDGRPSSTQKHLLDLLTRSFQLTPWDRVAEHLDDLQREYAGMIVLPSG